MASPSLNVMADDWSRQQMLQRDEEFRKMRHQVHDSVKQICDNTNQRVGKARETLVDLLDPDLDLHLDAVPRRVGDASKAR